MTNKTNVKGSERLGYSNLSEGEFSAYINNNDLFTFDYQIYEGLKIIENNPVGQISLYAFFNEISFSLNKPVTLNPIASLINLKDGDGNILFSYDYLDLSFDGVYYNIDTSAFTPAIGSYTVEIPKGLFSSTLQTTDFYSWTFNIVVGDYLDTDYSSDYLI
jgi:hypothetical protein